MKGIHMRLSTFAVTVSAGLLVASSAWADPPATTASPAGPAQPPAVAPAPETPAPQPAAEEDQERTAHDAVYLEGLGPGLLYSVNIERSFGDFAPRIGFGYVSLSVSAGGVDANGQPVTSTASASFYTIPITLSYLGIGSKKHMLELGAGATIMHAGAGVSTIDASSSQTANGGITTVLPVAIVGYRYQPPQGGFFFKGGISPIIAGSTAVLPWPYIALGGTFNLI
jgi:hypothetical protein